MNITQEIKKQEQGAYETRISSRFSITSKMNYDGVLCWNLHSWMNYDYMIESWSLYQVKENDKLMKISHKKYGTINYWWIISLFNSDISLNPYNLEKSGVVLKIPDHREIVRFLDTFRVNLDE